MIGEALAISCWLDFKFYDPVWYWDGPSSPDNPQIGRWLGIANCIGTDLCYIILNMKGNVLSRTTMHHVTKLDLAEDNVKKRLEQVDAAIIKCMDDDEHIVSDNYETPQIQQDFDLGTYENDEAELVKEVHADGSDDYSPEAYGTLFNAKFLVPEGDGHIKGIGNKHRKGKNGNLVGIRHENPMLDTRSYKVKMSGGSVREYLHNQIGEEHSKCWRR
eukprot:14549858-Ditylum_brightwellii.AAC.1